MSILSILLVIGVVVIWSIYKSTRDNDERAVEYTAEDIVPDTPQCKCHMDVIMESLRKLQCNPELIEDKDGEGKFDIPFFFQAEHFVIKGNNNSAFFTICDSNWYSFDEKDIYQLGAVKRIVNDLNYQAGVNVCYSSNSENSTCVLFILASLACIEGDTFDDLLAQKLQECFVVHHLFFKMLAEEMANRKD